MLKGEEAEEQKNIKILPGTTMTLSPNSQKGEQKNKFLAKESAFHLDDEHMFKTLSSKSGAYEKSLGAAVLHLGEKSKPDAVKFSGDKGDEISVMSEASGKSKRSKNVINKEGKYLH